MPLTNKGESILHSMEASYPSEEKAEQVFYASRNAGTITGVDTAPEGVTAMEGHRIDDLGKSTLHAADSEGLRVKNLGESVLHADQHGAVDAAFQSPGGNSGALISPAPGLGMSAYQSPKVPDGN